ncbi:MAG: J domain-containing protein [Neomegalonema sp.]|nr:J domain-containing protein [Neomegalonema sp.]
MTGRKPLDFDISVGAAKKRAAKKRGRSGAVNTTSEIQCEWPDCTEKGTFRAPYSRDRLDEYRWFCQAHVREYNARWNFYENMSEDEIAQNMAKDRLWGRDTWTMGKANGQANPHSDGMAWKRNGFTDPLDVLGVNATLNPGANLDAKRAKERTLPKTVRKALEIFELDALTTRQEIRLRYKELVKRYHPDQNGGDRSEEARLQDVLWAWEQLKSNTSFPDKPAENKE